MRIGYIGRVLWIISAAVVAGSAPPAIAQSPTPKPFAVHPLCVQKLATMLDFRFQSTSDAVSVSQCNRSFARAKVSADKEWFFADEPKSKGPMRPYYGYRVVGLLDTDLALLEVTENTGGTGIFSAFVFVSGWPSAAPSKGSHLTTAGILQGGDRCDGGAAGIEILSPTKLRVSEMITPYDLFTVGATIALQKSASGRYETIRQEDPNPPSAPIRQLKAYESLDNAATSCIGTAAINYDLKAGTSTLTSITLTDLNDDDPAWVNQFKYQACFNRFIKAAIPTFPQTLTPTQVRAMSDAFEGECLK